MVFSFMVVRFGYGDYVDGLVGCLCFWGVCLYFPLSTRSDL